MSQQNQLPIFTKTSDFLAWLTPQTRDFPKLYRDTFTKRLLNAGFNFLEEILDANRVRGRERLAHLQKADAHLDKVRYYLRLAHGWKWLSPGQYSHAANMISEIGRMLGGWQKSMR